MNNGWAIFQGSDEEWDQMTASLEGSHLYQTAAYSLLSQRLGKQMLRFIHCDGKGHPISAFQAHYQSLVFKGAYLFCRGGILGNLEVAGTALLTFLKQHYRLRYVYLRMFSLRTREAQHVTTLLAQGFKPSLSPINTGLTMRLSLGEGSKALSELASSNWRHNLKRGLKRTPVVELWSEPDLKAIVALYRSMESFKNIRQQFLPGELEGLFEQLKGKIFVFRALDDTHTPVAIRAYARHGDEAFDLLAANSPKGREIYASHALLQALLEHCRSQGILNYDLAGIDPKEGSGVYHFKRGTGADHHEYLGEWDLASSTPVRLILNALLWWRIHQPLSSLGSALRKKPLRYALQAPNVDQRQADYLPQP